MRTSLLCLLLLLPACDHSPEKKSEKAPKSSDLEKAVAAVKRSSEKKKESFDRNRLSPALQFLPAGSTLKDVQIPRYDKEKRRAALVRAKVLKVLSEEHVSSDNLELRVFSKEEEEEVLRVQMGSADYYLKSGLLEAGDLLTITGDNVRAEGAAGIFHLDSRQGFIRGPISTAFVPPPKSGKDAGEAAPDRKKQRARPPRPVLAELVPEFIEPRALTPAELEEIGDLLQSRTKSVVADRAPTMQLLTLSQQLSQSAEIGLRSFSGRVERANLLARVTPGAPSPPGQPKQPMTEEILITSQGGMYIDGEKGHIAYLRNVEVTESRFVLRCSNRLLLFFETKEGFDGQNLERPEDFADLKTIVAIGGVRVERRDPKKDAPPIVATAETAVVDVKTGDFVLQGGSPTIQQGLNVLRAEEPDLYLRYYANGNIFADKGRWTTVGDLTSLASAPNKKDKEKKTATTEDDPGAAKEKEGAGAEPQTIAVTCTGGMYFDAKDGHLAYLGNVEITEPRFTVRCEKEVKVFLRRSPEAEAKELKGPEAFSDVNYIVASGDVQVTRATAAEAGDPATASAEHVIVDTRNGDIILQGGSPTIKQGDNALEAGSPELYLRFYENGSLFAEPGKWTTSGDLANLRNKPGEKKKPSQFITATSRGGLYFDSLKGHIVYLRDVVVQEPRFRMSCKDELKILLQERAGGKGERLEGPEAFSDVKGIIARGDVVVVKRDPRGKQQTVTASAETAVYEAKSGDIVLRDGFPAIQQGKNFAKALERGLFIRFYANGSVFTNEGKWDINIASKDFKGLWQDQKDANQR